MNKNQLAELYSKKDYPTEEFIRLPIFAALEDEADAVGNIEAFRLPEITKLICCSTVLSQCPWAEKYADIRPIYQSASHFDPFELLEKYPDPKEFERAILAYADARILNILMMALMQRNDEKREINKQLSQLDPSKISVDEFTKRKAAYEQKINQVDKRIADINTSNKKWKSHFDLIQIAIAANNEEAIESRRAKAYESLTPSITAEEEFLEQFIREGHLTETMMTQLQSNSFCKSILRYLDQPNYHDIALPTLMRLYEQGAIDIEVPHIMEYIRVHAALVSNYLCQNLFDALGNEKSENRALLEVALRIESTYSANAPSAIFKALWSSIKESDCWIVVLQIASNLDLPDIHDVVYAVMKGLADDASEALAEALFSPQVQEMHINATEIVGSALRNQIGVSPSLIIAAFLRMEQLSRSAQRKLRTADRMINSQGQKLFRSIYEPVERLEIVASNLRLSKENIPCQLVANELIDIVSNLRSGMIQMNLHPVCDVEEWRKGYPIPFDAVLHRKPMSIGKKPENVILQTMGFRYLGDDGEWQQYNALVVPKSVRNTNSQLPPQKHSISKSKQSAVIPKKNYKQSTIRKVVLQKPLQSKMLPNKSSPKQCIAKDKEEGKRHDL